MNYLSKHWDFVQHQGYWGNANFCNVCGLQNGLLIAISFIHNIENIEITLNYKHYRGNNMMDFSVGFIFVFSFILNQHQFNRSWCTVMAAKGHSAFKHYI